MSLTLLALALALAERLADLGAGTHGHEALESLFIDEDFGALDTDETLDQVIQALESLQTNHRVLGVVTHLTKFAERVPTHIRVKKPLKRAGSRSSGDGPNRWVFRTRRVDTADHRIRPH